MNKRGSAFAAIACFLCLLSCNNTDTVKDKMPPINNRENLKKLVKQYPDSLLLIQDLIEIYRNDAAYDSALALTENAIGRDSGNAYLWNMKATLHFENGDTIASINALEHAVNIYPLPEYLIALGTVYAEVKDKKSLAIADNIATVSKAKYGKDAFFLKGLYYTYSGDKPKAISYFDSSLNVDFTYMYSYREKAIAQYDLGKYQQALQTLKRAVTIQNNFEEGYYWMGKCYEKMHQPDDAIQSYQNALLYDKNFVEAREALDRLQRG